MAEDLTNPLRVLIVDDEPALAATLADSLDSVGYACQVATSGREGLQRIQSEEFDVLLTDLRLGDMDGMALLRHARKDRPDAEVIVITGFGDVKTAVEAIKLGAAHFLLKPPDLHELRTLVARAAERVQLARANRELRRQLDEKFGFEGVIGNSAKMQKVLKALRSYAPTSARVLVLGENGTGKELVAKALHTNSPRKNKPFVALNCTALNENLLDDELFGHEKGAYTGAEHLRKGRFEYANGGTLFLDEVGDMPLALQAKLLRVLENGEVVRIGSNEAIKIDVRVISATNRHLETAIAEGKFRQDLYQRLKVGTIVLPPLRERREDLPLLTAHFLKLHCQTHGKKVSAISEPVRKGFAAYDWPGNVRELGNLIESMVVLDSDGVLGLDDLPEGSGLAASTAPLHETTTPIGSDHLIGKPLWEVERYYSEKALELTGGNREEAARLLRIGERTLYRNIQDWKLQDRIRAALTEANGDVSAAAATLGLKPAEIERKLKKWGMIEGRADDESE